MTDNRTNGQASVTAFKEWHAGWWKNLPNPIAESNAQAAFFAGWEAALVAAAGVAPQAESASISQALGFLDHLNAQNHIDWINYSRLHDLISAIAPVQPSSTVDVEKIARVIYEHSETDEKGSRCATCGFFSNGDLALHQARAVVEAIGGEGR